MKFLELKLPPIILWILFTVAIFFIAWLSPPIGLLIKLRFALFLLINSIAAAVCISAILLFKKANTTLHPAMINQTSYLVQKGIYRYSRNPIYLGFSLSLLGFSLMLDSALGVLLVPIFMLYLTWFQIKPEEKGLLKIFGKQYEHYQQQTPRWFIF